MALTPDDAVAFEACIRDGGVVLFGADTVYGLACDPGNTAAVERIYELKGRAPDKPAAHMAFSRPVADWLLAACGARTREAAMALLPGAVTLILPGGLGVRFPDLSPHLTVLGGVGVAVMQTSANFSGGPEAQRFEDVDPAIVAGVDLALDCGELAGTASTVIDLRGFENAGVWEIVREGAVPAAHISATLG